MSPRKCSHICKCFSHALAIAGRIIIGFDAFDSAIVVAQFVLHSPSGMNNRQLKVFLATLLASMLLYYSAAWALLRCCHEGQPAIVERSMSADDRHDGLHSHLSRPIHAPAQFDCLDFEYQSEVLGGPTLLPQFHRATTAVAPYANDFFALKSLADGHRKTLLRNVFTRGSPPGESSNPPLYISFSSLRI